MRMTSFFELLAILTFSGILANATDVPCCFSKRFLANITVVTGVPIPKEGSNPIVTENRVHVLYDKDMRRENATGYILSGTGSNQKNDSYNALNDYNSGKRYILTDSGRNCSAIPLTVPQFDNCVPATLQLASTYFLGSEKDAVEVNSWEGRFGNYMFRYITAVDGCTPISITRYGTYGDGTSMMEFMQFSEFVPLSKMQRYNDLDIPKAC